MAGIRLVHATARSAVVLIPIMSKPFPGPFHAELDKCPSCHQIHMVKTVHLTLDDAGTCIVSAGVLADLKTAGMPGLSVVAEVPNPPPLIFGPGVTRQQIDNSNRKIIRLAPPVHI